MAEIIVPKTAKKKSFLFKFSLVILLACTLIIGLRYWKMKAIERKNAQEISKFDNIESEIFDLSADKNHENDAGNLDESHFNDLTLTQLKEGGAEFIYKLLLKNQLQIAELKTANQNLQNEFEKYKIQQKTTKIIFVYVELRERFFGAQTYQETLRSFEGLAMADKDLAKKATSLKLLLTKFSGSEDLRAKFNALIPDLIATKNNPQNNNMLQKVRHNLSKLVVIRKLDANATDIDGAVRRAELALAQDDFKTAYDNLFALDANYHELVGKYLEELKNAAEIQKIDQEILLSLRALSQ